MKYLALPITLKNYQHIIHLGDFVSSEDALRELKSIIREDYPLDPEVGLKKCILYEIKTAYDVDVEKMYKSIEDEEKLKVQLEEEKKERELYEKLKLKFENKNTKNHE